MRGNTTITEIWNMKQQDGAEELIDFITIHGLQRFIAIYPTGNSKNWYH